MYDDGGFDACGNCGLAPETIRQVLAARSSVADEKLKAQFEELALRAGRAEAALVSVNRKLERIRAYFGRFD